MSISPVLPVSSILISPLISLIPPDRRDSQGCVRDKEMPAPISFTTRLILLIYALSGLFLFPSIVIPFSSIVIPFSSIVIPFSSIIVSPCCTFVPLSSSTIISRLLPKVRGIQRSQVHKLSTHIRRYDLLSHGTGLDAFQCNRTGELGQGRRVLLIGGHLASAHLEFQGGIVVLPVLVLVLVLVLLLSAPLHQAPGSAAQSYRRVAHVVDL
jgi:hypothetical protein